MHLIKKTETVSNISLSERYDILIHFSLATEPMKAKFETINLSNLGRKYEKKSCHCQHPSFISTIRFSN